MKKNNRYKGGNVSLLSCNTGLSYAQKLANQLGANMYDPTGYSTSDGKGMIKFSPQKMGL